MPPGFFGGSHAHRKKLEIAAMQGKNSSAASRRSALKMGALAIAGGAVGWDQWTPSLANGAEHCIESVPGTGLTYYLIPYDDNGVERPWAGTLCSEKAIQHLSSLPITDVFIFSHGWKGADCKSFDPQELYQALKADRAEQRITKDADIRGFPGIDSVLDLLLVLLRTVSFWKMKDRARQFGETSGHQLLVALQNAVPHDRAVRFHLMGHSFGCIVVSATLAGPRRYGPAIQPVHSVSLIQGALSLWSFCSNFPYRSGLPGYFRPIIDRQLVGGPIITTQSRFDTAVSKWYPRAAGVARQVFYAKPGDPAFPEYAGVGIYGIQGENCNPQNIEVLPATASYAFRPGMIYNIESSRVICNTDDATSGAHSDICHPEIAHAVWQAATVEVQRPPQPAPAPPVYPPSPCCGRLRRIKRRRCRRSR
jgi:hypothetical protein